MNEAFEKILDMLEEERELSYADFSRYVEEVSPCLDDEYDDFFHRGLERASRLVKEVAEEYNGGWISVKDRLPDKAGSYLVIGKSGGATVTRWYMPSEFYPEGHFGGNSTDYIRYWMPRPEPPKERE